MKRTKLIIASVLKTVDDTRMYEKFALSLSQTNKYDINIIGFYSKNNPEAPTIRFHPIFNFKRISPGRLLAPTKYFFKILQLKPEVLIVKTHELLLVTALYKILFGGKVIYDVQENYYRNIKHTKAFPTLLRPIIAGYVRGKEYLSRLFVDHYFVAERHYEKEFSFTQKKSTIIENKYKPLELPQEYQRGKKRLLFSGTIADSTGVFQAIELAKNLHDIDSHYELLIIGYCAIATTLKKIKAYIHPYPYIKIKGGGQLVQHTDIVKAIQSSDFGIIYYPKNLSTINSIPTKLFEYLGNQLPIIMPQNPTWKGITDTYDAAIIIDFKDYDARQIHQQLKRTEFYKIEPGNEVNWQSEEKKLLHVIGSI